MKVRETNYLGEFINSYKPSTLNVHRVVNYLLTSPKVFQSAIIQQTKSFPDVSFYQQDIDWNIMRTHTDAAIIRAGQNLWPDTEFVRNWKEAKRVGIKRGVYWFYDDRTSPGNQANLLISLLKDDLPEMEVWCDWEKSFGGSYGSLANVVAFMQAVEKAIPVKMGMYTGYYWFVDHSNAITNYSQYNYLKTKPLWLAWYAAAEIVKIPAPWTSLLVWQYGTPAIGSIYGVKTLEIDMNYFNGTQRDFDARYLSDTITQPFPDVKQVEGMRNGWKFWLHILDPEKTTYKAVHPNPMTNVSAVASQYNPQIAWNGGESFRDGTLKDYSVGDGIVVMPRQTTRPSFVALKDGSIDITNISPSNTEQAITGIWWLMREGVIEPNLYTTAEPRYTEGHSRSVHGLTPDGYHLVLTSEGKYPNQGLTLLQCAEIMKQYGAFVAFDSGGGGDTTVVVEGIRLNTPEDIVNGENVERRLPQVLLAFTETGEEMATRYEAVAVGDGTRLRSDHNTAAAVVLSYPTGTKFHGDTLFVATQELRNSSGVVYQKVGDKWLQVKDVNGNAQAGWVAIIHMGQTYCTLVDNGEVTTPTLKHTIEIYSDGSVKVDGNFIP